MRLRDAETPLYLIPVDRRILKDATTGEELAAVYVPTTPNPTSGYIEIVPLARVISTDWMVDEAMSFAITGGTSAPERIHYSVPATVSGMAKMPGRTAEEPAPNGPRITTATKSGSRNRSACAWFAPAWASRFSVWAWPVSSCPCCRPHPSYCSRPPASPAPARGFTTACSIMPCSAPS